MTRRAKRRARGLLVTLVALSLVAGPVAPPAPAAQTVDTTFPGPAFGTDSPFRPPDTMGAVGPTQYLVAVNGRIRVYSKTGVVGPLNATLGSFFAPAFPVGYTSDPQVRFDRLSGRWFVTAIDVPPSLASNHVLMAVSTSDTITATSFSYFSFQHDLAPPVGDSGCFADYDSLGIDASALYIGVNQFCGPSFNTTVFVVRKSSLTGGGPPVVTAFRGLITGEGGPFSPRGVDNDDPTPAFGYVIGDNLANLGELALRRISDPGGTPTISANVIIPVGPTGSPIDAPSKGSTKPLDAIDGRLLQAHVRNGRLWTARAIGVNSGGGAVGVNRDGARWYEIGDLDTLSPTVLQTGTVFDPSATNPVSYIFPSVMVSGQGHAAMGMTVTGANSYADAAFTGRLAGDASGTMSPVTRYTNGATPYNPPFTDSPSWRWGDYSATSLDPCDDMSLWTIQEHTSPTGAWATQVARLLAPPPATPSGADPPELDLPGSASVLVTITGTVVAGSGFFDPGPDFGCHITATVPGIPVNQVIYNDPTHVTLDLNTAGATPGAKNVTITNPDGQSITGFGFNVTHAPIAELTATPASGFPPLAVTFTVSGTDPDNAIANYRLDFGDATFTIGSWLGPPFEVLHTYGSAGNFTARLTITDTVGLTGQDTALVTVHGPPTAALAATPSSGTAPLAVDLSTQGTGDPNGDITSWSLDFGDGTSTSGSGPPPAIVAHTYTAAGMYVARLTVTDATAATAGAEAGITVSPPPPPPPPPAPPPPPPPPRVFLFAEGTTRPGFFEELDLVNTRADASLAVRVTYQYSQDTPHPPLVRTYTVGPSSTLAINVNAEAGAGNDVSLRVEETGGTTNGLVAERQLYFDYTSRGPFEPHWTGLHSQVGAPAASATWLFGEGTTLDDFTEFLTLQNPDPATPSTVRLTYQPDRCQGPAPTPKTFVVPPSSRVTVRVSDPTDARGAGGVTCVGLGASVVVTGGPPVVAERPLYFVHDFGSGIASDGHDSFGATAPVAEAFFSEGSTLAGLDEFLTLVNPGSADAAVTIDYADEAGAVTSRSVAVPSGQRTTVRVGEAFSPGGLGPDRVGVSVHLRSSRPIVAERPMYVVRDVGSGLVTGGHDALGFAAPGNRLSFAGGSTAPGHDTFLTIQNPDPTRPAVLRLGFLSLSGQRRDALRTVPPHSRATLRLSDPDLAGPDLAGPIGTVVESEVAVVVERPTYVVDTVAGLSISGAADARGFEG